MFDEFNQQNVPETPDTPVAPQEPTPSVAPQEPVTPPAPQQQPTPPVAPQPPISPMNGWSNDGSYRYVPPRNDPPQNGGYQSPCDGTPNSPRYTAPQQPVYHYGSVANPSAPQTPPPQPPRKGRGWIVVIAILCAVALVAGVVGSIYALSSDTDGNVLSDLLPDVNKDPDLDVSDDDDDKPTNENAPTLEINEWDTDDGGLSTEEIVKRNYDSTVVLTAYSQTGGFYFGESSLTEAAAASGIVMTKDGYIITNRHCVIDENSGKAYDRIDVSTYDGKTYEDAEIIGTDESTDLAVIKVDATSLTPASFGDSDELAVGARVVALGNAAGLSWTATQGIVSAKARDVYDDTGYAIKCLQVDVAINSGNSGGPLLNKQGLVVGINSAKIFAAGYEGLGFSIPINEAKVVIDSLMKNGYVKGRVALGITGQTIDSGEYKVFMIASIESGSCLEGTGAQINDLIVAVDGVTVTDYGTLRAELAKHEVGDRVTLKLLRSDRRTGKVTSFTVTATLKEQKAN